MKNTNSQSGESSVRRFISMFLVFATLAFSTFATATNSKNMPPDDGKNVQLVNASHPNEAVVPRSDRDMVGADSLDRDLLLIAQGPEWCYTTFGPYLMAYWMPPGSYCQVNVTFYPYVLSGTVGY
jgi:hypothetical protein